jgi:predicted ATPase
LTGGSRTVLPRQQTLRATMDWSYVLLPEHEQTLLNQLSVFAGNFSLDAVEAVYVAKNESKANTLDVLTALVDNSLVIVEEDNTEARYSLLETVRQYAFEKLQTSDELQATQDRHLAYFLNLAEQGVSFTYDGDPVWMNRFETEYDNFRVAMEHAFGRNLESAVRLEKSLEMFWDLTTSRLKESYTWAMRIVSLTETWQPSILRAMALYTAGWRAVAIGETQIGQALLEASLEMAGKINDKNQMKESLQALTATSWIMRN